MKNITITVDVEEDCPPMLTSTRGMEEGLPKLLDLFKKEGIKATFFVTGMMAEQYPDLIYRIPKEGHELGCHGYTHARFDRMEEEEARIALKQAGKVLRQFEKRLVSFRAPNLQFPEKYLKLLEEEGFLYDSSLAAYKPPFSQKQSRRQNNQDSCYDYLFFFKAAPRPFSPAAQARKSSCTLCPSLGIRGHVRHAYTPGLQVQYRRKSPPEP